MREGRPAYKGDLHCRCARNLLRNPLLDTNFAVFTRAAQENRTDCAWPGVETETKDKRPPCWFLLLPLQHFPRSVVVCSRADCSCLSGIAVIWLQRTFQSQKPTPYILLLLCSPFLCNPPKKTHTTISLASFLSSDIQSVCFNGQILFRWCHTS